MHVSELKKAVRAGMRTDMAQSGATLYKDRGRTYHTLDDCDLFKGRWFSRSKRETLSFTQLAEAKTCSRCANAWLPKEVASESDVRTFLAALGEVELFSAPTMCLDLVEKRQALSRAVKMLSRPVGSPVGLGLQDAWAKLLRRAVESGVEIEGVIRSEKVREQVYEAIEITTRSEEEDLVAVAPYHLGGAVTLLDVIVASWSVKVHGAKEKAAAFLLLPRDLSAAVQYLTMARGGECVVTVLKEGEDLDEVMETTMGLWEPGSSDAMGSLAAAVEAARRV